MNMLLLLLLKREKERKREREMGRRRGKSYTLPSSPSHSFSSSSSSDFEFTISISPRKSSSTLCPADQLFYKGQLLPLHLSPRISMVRTLLLSSSSSSSSTTTTTTTTTTRSSTDSHSSFNSDLALLPHSDSSSRPSSVTDFDNDDFNRLHNTSKPKSTNKYFSFSTFSSVKRISTTAKEVIRKYFNKVKPLYEKFSHKHKTGEFNMEHPTTTTTTTRSNKDTQVSVKRGMKQNNGVLSHSFSGNLRYPRSRTSCVSSCPSSMRSSPTHSGVLSFPPPATATGRDASSMEELQSAIQGAITHCKNSLIQNQTNNIVSSY
ncbi:PREDICTED: probable membrane-associated kinase regulator 1 [Lupinus angustifolius]|uniref:probable membrane-associated kinase regulator 1 n=1 Tax=Lupinus angustifolius TaxID=3871 RepID=UPI00092E9C16|nr:PREDICTED: probable membrane-associated kinase regulator 1 [Lupinus angustifolius]